MTETNSSRFDFVPVSCKQGLRVLSNFRMSLLFCSKPYKIIVCVANVLIMIVAAVCNTAIPQGQFLFGDLSQLTKDIGKTNKLTKIVCPSQ